MSFDLLPPELLRDIIEAAIPRSYLSTTYAARQQTLCSLCLVSRRFHQIASPLLSEIVRIELEQNFQQVLKSLSANDRIDTDIKTRKFIFSNPHPQWFNASALDMLSVVCPALSALTITVYDGRHPSLDQLSPFPDLSDLHLYGLSFHLATPFPSLQSLTLSGFRAISTFFSNSESVVLPSLRYLALSHVDEVFQEFPVSDKSMLVRLLPQLEAWSIDIDGLEDAALFGGYYDLAPFLSRALVDYPIDDQEFPLASLNALEDVQHLRLLHHFSKDKDKPELPLPLVTSIIDSLSHPVLLRSIYLDQSSQRDPDVNNNQARLLRDVEKICKEKGIELVFDEQPHGAYADPVISQEFWKRMKMERRQG